MGYSALPDAIILEVALLSDINTLKSLRLVCRSFHDLIEAYGTSLRSDVLSRLYSRSVVEHFSLASCKGKPIKGLSDMHRRIELARWMAARRLAPPLQVLYEPSAGAAMDQTRMLMPVETIFEHLVIGLGILWRLSELSVDTIGEELSITSVSSEIPLLDLLLGHPRADEIEQRILQAQCNHMHRLSLSGKQGLHYAVAFFAWAQEVPRKGLEGSEKGTMTTNRSIWALLRAGPGGIARAWTSGKPDKFLWYEINDREVEQLDLECRFGYKLHLAIRNLLPWYDLHDDRTAINLSKILVIADDSGREFLAGMCSWTTENEDEAVFVYLDAYITGLPEEEQSALLQEFSPCGLRSI